MYLKRLEITNIRSISRIEWTAPNDYPAGWHVFLGNNGSGKTTLMRSIAAVALGLREIARLGLDNNSYWLRSGKVRGDITTEFGYDMDFDQAASPIQWPPQVLASYSVFNNSVTGEMAFGVCDETIWGNGQGWFIASFGPYRRFGQSGSNGSVDQMFSVNHKLARHVTLFSEDIMLKDVISWLKELEFRRLAGDQASGQLLEHIRTFINQVEFLPFRTRLDSITPDKVVFRDGNDILVDINSLSDGFRSILSLVFELIRHLTLSYPADLIFDANQPGVIQVPGVVLIDEIDVHLHPQWQMRVGQSLCSRFPKIQFMVTTHSPLACHAAAQGSVFVLPEQGSDEPGRFLTEPERNRLVYGNVLEAYGSGAFGDVSTRSERGKQLLEKLAELNLRDFRDGLTEEEKAKQSQLMEIFPMGTES